MTGDVGKLARRRSASSSSLIGVVLLLVGSGCPGSDDCPATSTSSAGTGASLPARDLDPAQRRALAAVLWLIGAALSRRRSLVVAAAGRAGRAAARAAGDDPRRARRGRARRRARRRPASSARPRRRARRAERRRRPGSSAAAAASRSAARSRSRPCAPRSSGSPPPTTGRVRRERRATTGGRSTSCARRRARRRQRGAVRGVRGRRACAPRPGERWPLEALRAQAIAARTYAAYHRQLNAAQAVPHPSRRRRTSSTPGACPRGSPVWARRAARPRGRCSGWRASFPGLLPHRQRRLHRGPAHRCSPRGTCPRCGRSLSSSPRAHRTTTGRSTCRSPTCRDAPAPGRRRRRPRDGHRDRWSGRASLRVAAVTVRGTRGYRARSAATTSGAWSATTLLKSTLFAVAIDGGVARFAGRGYGHGVGMCQWGATHGRAGLHGRQILDVLLPRRDARRHQ